MPKLGKTFYAKDRATWRRWLERHHQREPEIWLVYFSKASGKPRVPYNDAVEEALCFGWIDSVLHKVDADSFAQRFSPRRPKSQLSPMNRVRVERLIASGKMTPAGLEALEKQLAEPKQKATRGAAVKVPDDILRALKKDPATWKNFKAFSPSYQQIRIGWIDLSRHRPDEFKKRLAYFLKMTAKNKQYGMVR